MLGLFRFVCVGKIFVFHAATLQWYQSLDLFVDVGAIRTQGVVGVDVFVATFSCVLRILLDGWIEAPRTNFTRPRTRDRFHD